MPEHIYNRTMFAAWLLVSVGAGAIYWPAGLIVAGLGLVGILLLTLYLHRLGLRLLPRKAAAAATTEGTV